MAIPSSPPAIGLQQSIPPPPPSPQSGRPSAHHELTTPLSTARTRMSASVGQRQIQPPRRSPALVGSPHKQTSDTQPLVSRVEREPPTSAPHRQYRYFTSEDDALLIALYKKNEGHWPQIQQDFEKAGRPSRSKRVLYARYEVLQAHAVRQQDLANIANPSSSSSSTSTSNGQPLSEDAAMAAASSMLQAQLQLTQPWTSDEVQTLRNIPKGAPRKTIFPAFCAAFPLTRRTSMAVVAKWRRIHFEGQTQRRGGRATAAASAQGDGGTHDTEEAEGEQPEWSSMLAEENESCSILAMSPPAEQPERGNNHLSKATCPTSTASQMAHVLAPAPSPAGLSHQVDLPASWSANDSLDTADAATMHPRPTPDASSASLFDNAAQPHTSNKAVSTPQQARNPRTSNYSINRTPNGFLITDFPPGYTLLILTPTRCQVLGPDEQVLAQPEAPFAFTVKSDGDVEAINLPVGTQITREVVRQESHHLSLDRQARVKITFTAVDDYTVCFEGHAALEL